MTGYYRLSVRTSSSSRAVSRYVREYHQCSVLLILLQNLMGKILFTTDLWTDPNVTPYMGVTAHWIEAQPQVMPQGSKMILSLRADLIGFHMVPGHHTGECLATYFMYIVDRLGITKKVIKSV
jgi:hypothetical protein